MNFTMQMYFEFDLSNGHEAIDRDRNGHGVESGKQMVHQETMNYQGVMVKQ